MTLQLKQILKLEIIFFQELTDEILLNKFNFNTIVDIRNHGAQFYNKYLMDFSRK